MSDKKPSVMPTQDQINAANETGGMIAQQFEEEITQVDGAVSSNEEAAAEVMRRNTAKLIAQREANIAKNQKLADELEIERDKQMKMMQTGPKYVDPQAQEQAQQYAQQSQPERALNPPVVQNIQPAPMNRIIPEDSSIIDAHEARVRELSQPQMNQAFDLLPIPSEGKTYPSRKKALRVAYLTTSDENILTSPNLVESGEFLEILINRKLLEPELRYKDLLPGDRNAIMIWLRATGYGEKYGVTVLDKNNIPFETEIDLSKLQTINLNVEPDGDGLFNFTMPTSNDEIKFKILTVGDIDGIEKQMEEDKKDIMLENKETIYVLEKQIIEVNGNRDRSYIENYVRNIRIMDMQPLREYLNKIDCGIDLTIDIEAPGGESITTFLPLNPSFFWPNAQL